MPPEVKFKDLNVPNSISVELRPRHCWEAYSVRSTDPLAVFRNRIPTSKGKKERAGKAKEVEKNVEFYHLVLSNLTADLY